MQAVYLKLHNPKSVRLVIHLNLAIERLKCGSACVRRLCFILCCNFCRFYSFGLYNFRQTARTFFSCKFIASSSVDQMCTRWGIFTQVEKNEDDRVERHCITMLYQRLTSASNDSFLQTTCRKSSTLMVLVCWTSQEFIRARSRVRKAVTDKSAVT